MKRSTLRIATSLAAVVAVAGMAAEVAAKPGHGRFGKLDHLERKLARIELSAETQSATAAIIEEARPAERALRDQKRDAERDLQALLDADIVDEAAIMEQADVVGALSTQARKQQVRTFLQVRALLSPDEREQLAAMRKQRGDRHERHDRR